MAFKFFNIGKANEEIARLETEIANRDARIKELEAEKKALAENDSAVAEAAAKQRTELEAAQATVKRLEGEKQAADARIVQLEKDVTDAKASADKLAAAKAVDITAGQGQAPIVDAPAKTPAAAAKPDISKLTGLDKAIAAHKLSQEKK